MILAFLSYIASFLVFTFLPGFYFYLAAMVFFACGEAFRTGTHKAMILTYLELKRLTHLKVHYYGHTRGASQMGSALSSLLAMALVFYQGSFRWVFLASVVPYIMELFLMISYPAELDGDIKPVSGKIVKEIKERFISTGRDFSSLFKRRATITALLSSAVLNGFFKGIKDYLQPLIKKYALALPLFLSLSGNQQVTILIGITYFTLFLVTSFASKKSGAFAERIGHLPTGINGTFILGSLFVLLSGLALKLAWFELSILFFMMLYIVQGIRKPLNVAYISEQIAGKIMATGLSGESQLKTIFSALFSFLMGVLVQYVGLSAAIMMIALLNLVFYPMVRLRGKRQDH
jgi:MFS family permease